MDRAGALIIVRGSDPDKYDFDENDVVVTHEKSYAAGVPAVLRSLRRGLEQMGVVRTTRTLARLNQRNLPRRARSPTSSSASKRPFGRYCNPPRRIGRLDESRSGQPIPWVAGRTL
jgi:hypothetical protein